MLLRGASHVTVSGLDITLDPKLGPGAAVTLDVGAADNIARGNNQQAGRGRYFPGPGEIVVSAVNLPPGSTSGNTVSGNTAVTTVHRIPAFYLSANAGVNHIDPDNRWQQDPGAAPDASWGPVYVGKTWHSQASALHAYAELAR